MLEVDHFDRLDTTVEQLRRRAQRIGKRLRERGVPARGMATRATLGGAGRFTLGARAARECGCGPLSAAICVLVSETDPAEVVAEHPDLVRDEPSRTTLYRPRKGRLIAGVCAGIARWFGWDPTLVRIGYVALSVLSAAFPGILAYFILWLLMPSGPRGPRSFRIE